MPHVELPQAEFKVVMLGDTNTGKKEGIKISQIYSFYCLEIQVKRH